MWPVRSAIGLQSPELAAGGLAGHPWPVTARTVEQHFVSLSSLGDLSVLGTKSCLASKTPH